MARFLLFLPPPPSSPPASQVLINLWGCFSVIFLATYTANIAAHFAGLFNTQEINNFHDGIVSPHFPIHVHTCRTALNNSVGRQSSGRVNHVFFYCLSVKAALTG